MAKEHKMLHYDAGQALIKCADTLAEAETDLFKGGYLGHAGLLRALRLKIGDLFNELHAKEHGFGLPDSTM